MNINVLNSFKRSVVSFLYAFFCGIMVKFATVQAICCWTYHTLVILDVSFAVWFFARFSQLFVDLGLFHLFLFPEPFVFIRFAVKLKKTIVFGSHFCSTLLHKTCRNHIVFHTLNHKTLATSLADATMFTFCKETISPHLRGHTT